MNKEGLHPSVVAAYRVVLGFLLIALIWKLQIFRTVLSIYQNFPLESDFFPTWLMRNESLVVLYLTLVLSGFAVLFSTNPRHWTLQALGGCACCWGLLIHLGSYNDVTFMTAFWTFLWLLWYSLRARVDLPQRLFMKGTVLANLIVALILFAGSVGKWTGGYWSGEVLYEIYFAHRDYWCFNALRTVFDESSLRQISCGYSRIVIVTEGLGALGLVLLPRRWGAILGSSLLLGIALFSNILLFSVVLSLIGLMTVGLHFDKSTSRVA